MECFIFLPSLVSKSRSMKQASGVKDPVRPSAKQVMTFQVLGFFLPHCLLDAPLVESSIIEIACLGYGKARHNQDGVETRNGVSESVRIMQIARSTLRYASC
jgi:midasin (ATPase involved in ribosome maturation)